MVSPNLNANAFMPSFFPILKMHAKTITPFQTVQYNRPRVYALDLLLRDQPSPLKNLLGRGRYSVRAYANLLHDPFAAAAGVIGAAVCSGMFRRPRFALAEAVDAAVPVAASGSVLFEAWTSWMIVPFLLSYVTANMVPLLAIALATGRAEAEEPVERGLVEDEVALAKALSDAAGRVELLVGLGLTVTVTMVVFEKYTVDVERAAAALAVPLFFGADVIEAVLSDTPERLPPVACATPAVVLFEKRATVAWF